MSTLDPNNIGTSLVLSNGNLTVANTTTSWRSARSIDSHSTGVHYFETVVDVLPEFNYFMVGIIPDTASLTSYAGAGANSVSFQSNGVRWLNGSSTSVGTTFSVSDRVGVLIDIDNDEVKFYINGTLAYTETGFSFGGLDYFAAVSLYSGSTQGTVSLSAADIVNLPSGATAWVGGTPATARFFSVDAKDCLGVLVTTAGPFDYSVMENATHPVGNVLASGTDLTIDAAGQLRLDLPGTFVVGAKHQLIFDDAAGDPASTTATGWHGPVEVMTE